MRHHRPWFVYSIFVTEKSWHWFSMSMVFKYFSEVFVHTCISYFTEWKVPFKNQVVRLIPQWYSILCLILFSKKYYYNKICSSCFVFRFYNYCYTIVPNMLSKCHTKPANPKRFAFRTNSVLSSKWECRTCYAATPCALTIYNQHICFDTIIYA